MPIEWDDEPAKPQAAPGKIQWDEDLPPTNAIQQFGAGANEKLAVFPRMSADVADLVKSGIRRGLTALGIPDDLAEQAATYGNPLAVTGFLADQAATSLEPGGVFSGPEPQTTAQRIARRTGQEVGATVPLAAATMALAPAAPAVKEAGNAVQRGLASLMEGIRSTPGRAAVGELAATTGAGAGAGIAGEAAPGSQTAEMIGQLAGGLAPVAMLHTPSAYLARFGRSLVNRISPQATRQAATEAVQDAIGGEMTPQAIANLREAEKIAGGIEGFRPSLAEATNSPSLIATQRAIEKGLSGKALEMAAVRRQQNLDALRRFEAAKAPPGPGFDFVIDTASRKVDDIRAGIAGQQAEVSGARSAIGEALPSADRFAIGHDLRNRLVEAERQAADDMKALRQELGLNDADVTVPFGQFAENVAAAGPDSIFRDLRRYPDLMETIRRAGAGEVETGAPKTYEGPEIADSGGLEPGILTPESTLPEPTQVNVTFRDLMALREEIGFQFRNARAASSPDFRKVRLLGALREEVDNLLEGLDFPDPALSAAYKEFRQRYFTDYVERFRKGAAYKVQAKDGRGFYRTDDEDVATAFWAAGDVSAARQFKTVYGTEPQANAALEAVALDSLRGAAVRDGQVDQRLLQTWIRRHESVLAEFPAIRAKVADVEATNRALLDREAQLTQRARQIEDQVLVKALGSVAGGQKTPDQLLAEAMQSPQKMGQLKALVRGNEDAEKALARAIWNAAAGQRDLGTFIQQNEAALKLGLSPQHITDLKLLAGGREMASRVPAPTGSAVQPRPFQALEDATRMGMPQIASRIFAVQSGRTSWRFVVSEAGSRALRGYTQEQMEALLREALYDPRVAKDLANAVRMRKMPPAIANRLNVRLFNLGMETRDGPAEEEPRPEPSIIPRGLGGMAVPGFGG